jgi:hypothetical protein
MSQINARSETAATKPMFRAAFKKRRCLILANGYYEWEKASKPKQPYYYRMKDENPFKAIAPAKATMWNLMASLRAESWQVVDGQATGAPESDRRRNARFEHNLRYMAAYRGSDAMCRSWRKIRSDGGKSAVLDYFFGAATGVLPRATYSWN